MKKPLAMVPPSGRAPEQGSNWDRFGIEACGGAISFLDGLRMVSGFMGFIGGRIRLRGGIGGPHGHMARLGGGSASCPCGALEPLFDLILPPINPINPETIHEPSRK